MQALNCLIVEDEPLAAEVMADYTGRVPGLVLKGICEDAFQASEMLGREKIDLIFLDINLPKLSGLELIRSLRGHYRIILTTAYHQYALEGYELNVVDYLVKPVEFQRFLQAVNKAFDRTPLPGVKKHYFFNVNKTHVKIELEDILYVEALKDYVRIYTQEKKVVTKFQIGDMEKLLDAPAFLRIHKSFIVNTAKISAYSAMQVELKGTKLPIGRTYRRQAENRLRQFFP